MIPEVVLIVIGESLSRHHMQLYGYPKPTTPHLMARQNDLTVFRSATSTHSYTIGALNSALRFPIAGSREGTGRGPSLVAFLKHAGYQTLWISNQPSVGLVENQISLIALDANNQTFVGSAVGGRFTDQITTYDEKLLLPLERALSAVSRPTVVFVHLMGNHLDYGRRYPSLFETFPVRGRGPGNVVNSYDNSVLYNDWVIDEILKIASQCRLASSMFYFSDHGEEVYEDRDYCGHDPSNSSKYMFDIPFIAWFSPGARQLHRQQIHELEKAVNSPFRMNEFSPLIGRYLELEPFPGS